MHTFIHIVRTYRVTSQMDMNCSVIGMGDAHLAREINFTQRYEPGQNTVRDRLINHVERMAHNKINAVYSSLCVC